MKQETDNRITKLLDNHGCLVIPAVGLVGAAALGGGILFAIDTIAGPGIQARNQRVEKIQNEFQGNLGVVDLRTVPGFELSGSIGGFLAFSGQINGETKTILQFAWETNEQTSKTIISEVPLDKVIFVITKNPTAQEYNGPTVKFTLNDSDSIYSDDFSNGDLDVNNPNSIVPKDIKSVEFNMSQADFDSFRGNSTIGK